MIGVNEGIIGVDEETLRREITMLRESIRTRFESGARSDDPALIATAHAMAEREEQLKELQPLDRRSTTRAA